MADQTDTTPELDDTKVAELAAEHRATTQAAIATHREAERADTVEAHMTAARAALLAHRPAAAVRHLTRVGELAGRDQPDDLVMLKRDAEKQRRDQGRAIARIGGCFLAELVGGLKADTAQDRATGVEPRFSTTALLRNPPAGLAPDAAAYGPVDIINACLARVGSSQRLRLVLRDDGYADPVIEQAPVDKAVAEALAHQPDDGSPCEHCGAPRWTFSHDDSLGEFCAVCGWPLPGGDLQSARHRASNRELLARAGELKAELAARDAKVASITAELERANAKIEKFRRPAQLLSRRPGRALAPAGMALPTIPENATIDDLLTAARGAVEQITGQLAAASATLQQIEQAAVTVAQKAAEA